MTNRSGENPRTPKQDLHPGGKRAGPLNIKEKFACPSLSKCWFRFLYFLEFCHESIV